MEVKTATPQVEQQRAVLTELLMADQPPAGEDPKETTTGDNLLLALARRYETGHAERAAAGPRPRRGRLQPGHRRQPRRLHPLRPLRPRLRRHPGQRRHRPLRQGLRDADRVRPERPDGRVDLRHLRRVRRRLPDRRAGQQADPRRADPAARASSSRSTPSARTAASAARSPTTSTRSAARSRSPRAATQPGNQSRLCVKGRYGWDYAASAQRLTDAADPRHLPEGRAVGRRQGRGPRAQAAGRDRRLRRGAAALPRGDAGTRRSTSPPRG